MKRIIIISAVVLLGLVVAKKAHLGSFLQTLGSRVEQEVNERTPTSWKVDKLRNDIAEIDNKIRDLVRPIARLKVYTRELKDTITADQKALVNQRDQLLAMTSSFESDHKLVIAGMEYRGKRAEQRLADDFAAFKRLETKVKTNEQLLSAKEQQLHAYFEQAETLRQKRDEFRVRLAQIEANEELLKIQRNSDMPGVDPTWASEIEQEIRDLERRQAVERTEQDLLNGEFRQDRHSEPEGGSVTIDQIRNHLHQRGAVNTQEISHQK